MNKQLQPGLAVAPLANLLLAVAEGRINQFVRSGFKRVPTEQWPAQWSLLKQLLPPA